MDKTIIGVSLALVSTASWAVCTLILKKLGEKLDPIAMTTIKAFWGFLYLLLLVLITGTNMFLPPNVIVPVLCSSLLGIAIGDSLFFASLSRLSPLVLSLILFVGPDIFSGVFGLIFLGENPSILAWIGIVVVLIGLGCFIFPIKEEENQENKTSLLGVVFALLSLVCTAYSMVIIKPVLLEYSTLTVTMYRMLFSAIVLFVFAFVSKKIFSWGDALQDKSYNLKFVATIALATYGGFWLSLSAIKYCELVVAGTLMSLEPLFILLFMVLFCKYVPVKKEKIGAFLAVLGIVLISIG